MTKGPRSGRSAPFLAAGAAARPLSGHKIIPHNPRRSQMPPAPKFRLSQKFLRTLATAGRLGLRPLTVHPFGQPSFRKEQLSAPFPSAAARIRRPPLPIGRPCGSAGRPDRLRAGAKKNFRRPSPQKTAEAPFPRSPAPLFPVKKMLFPRRTLSAPNHKMCKKDLTLDTRCSILLIVVSMAEEVPRRLLLCRTAGSPRAWSGRRFPGKTRGSACGDLKKSPSGKGRDVRR